MIHLVWCQASFETHNFPIHIFHGLSEVSLGMGGFKDGAKYVLKGNILPQITLFWKDTFQRLLAQFHRYLLPENEPRFLSHLGFNTDLVFKASFRIKLYSFPNH